jgi:hypothetical protein
MKLYLMIILLILSLSLERKHTSFRRNHYQRKEGENIKIFQEGIIAGFPEMKMEEPCPYFNEKSLQEMIDLMLENKHEQGIKNLEKILRNTEAYDLEKCKKSDNESGNILNQNFHIQSSTKSRIKGPLILSQFIKIYMECQEALKKEDYKMAGKKFAYYIKHFRKMINKEDDKLLKTDLENQEKFDKRHHTSNDKNEASDFIFSKSGQILDLKNFDKK